MVYGLYVLSPVNGSFATVAGGITSADLTPAWRRQDHTISPSASAPLVNGTSASTTFRPTFRDDRDTPLSRGRMRERYHNSDFRKSNIFDVRTDPNQLESTHEIGF
jgi:hypothetical protein